MKKIATAVVALGFALIPTAASAHEVVIEQGSDRAWVNAAHDKAGVQDKECDGNNVRVDVRTHGTFGLSIVDENGCAEGGSQAGFYPDISEFRLCEDSWGPGWSCTNWKTVN